MILYITFGSGGALCSKQTFSDFNFTTSYPQIFKPKLRDAQFVFIREVPATYASWHKGSLDHTLGEPNGYMYALCLHPAMKTVFNSTVHNLCLQRCYQFSAYLTNFGKRHRFQEPDLRFEVRDARNLSCLIASRMTGRLLEHHVMTWSHVSLSFVASTDSVILLILADVNSTSGNDIAIDDIELRMNLTADASTCASGSFILAHRQLRDKR